MKKTVQLLAGLAMLLTAVVAAPTAAHADEAPSGIRPRDGNLYAWDKPSYESSINRPTACVWSEASTNWEGCKFIGGLWDMRNEASSVYNNSSGNRPVNLYYTVNYGGAWLCLHPGSYMDNLNNRILSWGPGKGGYRQNANDNISSHRWKAAGTSCGNHNP
ncbi:MAG TPA: peptidase inhibitor family I36 protein [Catenuloplanes sp.]